jgi:hypothetical protein
LTAGAVENGADRSVLVNGPLKMFGAELIELIWGGGRWSNTGLGWKIGSLGGGTLVGILFDCFFVRR